MVAGQQQSRRHATAAEIEGGAKGEMEENEENCRLLHCPRARQDRAAGTGQDRAEQDRAKQDRVGGFAGSESAVTVR
jgi:hypothetical protein